MKEEKIKVLALLPMELPKEIELDNTLEAMQKFVGGLIESSRILTTKMVSANRSLPGSLPPIRPTPPAIPTPAFVTAQASTRIS